MRNSGWISTSAGTAAILSFFYLAIMARSLGPAGFGMFATIMAGVRIMVAFLRFDTWQVMVKFGGPYLARGEAGKFSALAARCLRLEIAGGAAAAAIICFILLKFGPTFKWDTELIPATILVAAVILLCPRSSASGILRVHDKFGAAAIAEAMIPLTRMAGSIVVLFVDPTVEAFLIVWAVAEICSTAIFWLMVRRHTPVNFAGIGRETASAVKTENSSFWNFFVNANLVNIVASMREHLVVIIVGFFVGAAPAGLFRLASQLAASLVRFSDIFALPLFTELSRIYAAGRRSEFRRLFLRSLRMSTVSGIAAILILILLGKPILVVMGGEEFAAAYPLLVLLGAATAVGLIGLGLDPLLQAAGRPHVSTAIRMAALMVTMAGLALFLSDYGVMAAAASVFAGAIVTILLSLAFAIRLVRGMR